MPLRSLLALVLFPLLAAPALAQPAMMEHPMLPRTVTATASDTVLVVPDRATLHFAVVTRASEPEAARQQNAEAAASALNAVRDLGIPERQIQLLNLRLDEEFEYRNDRRVRIGFIARRDVKVIVDDLSLLPRLVAAVVQEGANELNGIQYGLQDRQAAELAALERAAEQARRRAERLAGTLGAELGDVLTITEGSVSVPPPRPYMAAARAEMAMSDTGTPEAYAAGEIEVRATVSVTFAIE